MCPQTKVVYSKSDFNVSIKTGMNRNSLKYKYRFSVKIRRHVLKPNKRRDNQLEEGVLFV